MALETERRSVDGIVILDLQGRLVAPQTIAFREQTRALLDEKVHSVILNLAEVSFIDSSGLGTLVALHSDFRAAGGAMKLERLSKRHIQLLVLTKLSVVFETFEDERLAIDSFFPDRVRRSFDILEFVQDQEQPPE